MGKSFSKSEMVSSLSRVERIFVEYQELTAKKEAIKAELKRTKEYNELYRGVDDSKKISHKFSVYVIAFIICVIVGIVGYNITKLFPSHFVGTYSCDNNNSGVSLELTVNPDNTFELNSNVYNFEGTWNKADSDPKFTIELRVDDDYMGYLHWTSLSDGYPYVDISNYGDFHIFENLNFSEGEVKPYLPFKSIVIIVIICLLSPLCERASVKSHNRGVDSCMLSAESMKTKAVSVEAELKAITSQMISISTEYRKDFADWYPPKYSYPEAAAYFRELFENNRVSNMREAMDKFEEYLYRNEMLRMQYKQKELMTKQMALQRDTYNSVNENFAKLSEQIATDGAMTRAAVVAEGESIKHRVSKEANNINNNMAAESARINKNIKKYSPFS